MGSEDVIAGAPASGSTAELEQWLARLRMEVAAAPRDAGRHLEIYEIAQILRLPELALEHQRQAVDIARIHSTSVHGRRDYTLLVPMVLGLFTANTPVDLIFDTSRVELHRWYIDPDDDVPELPRFDAVFVAIGESTAALPALRAVERFTSTCNVPVVNRPSEIVKLGRVPFAQTFANAQYCRVVPTVRVTVGAYAADGFPMPHIVRPVDSHGGHGLERVDDDAQRAAFAAAHADAAELYVQPFVDYRSGDGFYRKYRIIFVDGVPYPFHLAISPRWMVHYYNAPMTEHAWMRDEERAFLANIGRVFDGELSDALREAASLLPLEYVGIDCAIDRDGKLLIFEADNALIVHLLDDPAMFGYKSESVSRIKDEIDVMVRRRLGPR